MVNLFVSSLDYSVTQKDLFTLFKPYGYVKKVSVPTDKETGKARGFAFVEIDAKDAEPIIRDLNGKELNGRAIVIKLAEDKRGGNSSSPSPRPSSSNYSRPHHTEDRPKPQANDDEPRSFEKPELPHSKQTALPKKKKAGKDKDSTSDGNRKLKMSAYKKNKGGNFHFDDDDDDDLNMEDFY